MTYCRFYADFTAKLRQHFTQHGLLNERVLVTGRPLSVEEAIGNPKRRDYPLVKGKERLVQASFKGAKGQAFTDMPGDFQGTLQGVLARPLKSNFDRAVLVATANAVCRHLGLIENTVHCHDEEPEECAGRLVEYIQKRFGRPNTALVGLQPAMLDKLSLAFPVRVVDRDPDNIGEARSGIVVEDPAKTIELLDWCDLVIVTGSTVANGTIAGFYRGRKNRKPTIFYGTTAAAAAELMGFERFCPMSS